MDCSIHPYIFTLLLQILIDVLTVYTLVLKFHWEHHPRTKSNFYLDTYKQLVCNLINIFMNYGIAKYIGEICNAFYFLLWTDFFLTTPIHLLFVYCIDKYAIHNKYKYLIQGFRSNEKLLSIPNLLQNLIFCFSFLFCKCIVFLAIIYPAQHAWKNLSHYTLDKMTSDSNIQYILTFVVFPFLFNINRYWMIDGSIKGNKLETNPIIDHMEAYSMYAEL